MLVACKFYSFFDHSEMILSSLNVLCDCFSSVCPAYSSFTSFMGVIGMFMQVGLVALEILVIL